MWGTTTPTESTRPEDEWRRLWFDYPFGVNERCRELDSWATGKHQKNVAPDKLSDNWTKRGAQDFFADYEAMMLAHCQKKWPRMDSEAWPSSSGLGLEAKNEDSPKEGAEQSSPNSVDRQPAETFSFLEEGQLPSAYYPQR